MGRRPLHLANGNLRAAAVGAWRQFGLFATGPAMIRRLLQPDSREIAHDSASLNGDRVTASRSTTLERRLLQNLLAAAGSPPLIVELWDGERFLPSGQEAVGTIKVSDRGTLTKLLADPNFQFGEMYSAGRLCVEGRLDEIMTEIFRAMRCASEQASLWMKLFMNFNIC